MRRTHVFLIGQGARIRKTARYQRCWPLAGKKADALALLRPGGVAAAAAGAIAAGAVALLKLLRRPGRQGGR